MKILRLVNDNFEINGILNTAVRDTIKLSDYDEIYEIPKIVNEFSLLEVY